VRRAGVAAGPAAMSTEGAGTVARAWPARVRIKASSAAAALSVAAAYALPCMPSVGIRKNEVISVPAIAPAESAIAARRRYAEGAAPAWRALRRATREGSPRHIIPALYRWMDQSHEFGQPARLDSVERLVRLDNASTRGIEPVIDAVNRHYSDQSGARVHWIEAEDALRRVAKRARSERKTETVLPPLNRY
jgi:hypothetical protein